MSDEYKEKDEKKEREETSLLNYMIEHSQEEAEERYLNMLGSCSKSVPSRKSSNLDIDEILKKIEDDKDE